MPMLFEERLSSVITSNGEEDAEGSGGLDTMA